MSGIKYRRSIAITQDFRVVAKVDHRAKRDRKPFAYTGRLLDQYTGLQNNLHRWYDASVGRWLSEDPIGFAAGDANLYRYVGNGPVNGTDPTGLQAIGGSGGFDPFEGTPWEQQPIGGGPSEAQDFFTKCLRDLAKDWVEEQVKPQVPFTSTLGPLVGPGSSNAPSFNCKLSGDPDPKNPEIRITLEWTY